MLKNTDSDAWILPIRAVPNASRNEVLGFESQELKVKLRAVPEDGKANKELIKFLCKQVGITRSCIEFHSGETSRHKRLKIVGISQSDFLKSLGVSSDEKP